MPIRIILADDHPIILKGIRDNLAATSDITVVAEAANGKEAVDLVKHFQPDVLLLDMEMPEMNGIEVTRCLKSSGSAVHILAFSGHDDTEYIFGTLNEGAAGYLTKDEPMDEVIAAIRGIAKNQQGWYSRKIKEKLVARYQDDDRPGTKITPQEARICNLIQEGKTNRQIAFELQVSEKMVEKYLSNLFRTFDIVSRVQLAVLFMRDGISNGAHTHTYAMLNQPVEVP